MRVCGTGHRPDGCEPENIVRLKVRTKLKYGKVNTFVTGMAAGFDLWAGDEALLQGLEIWCAVPWRGHGPRKGDEELYERLIQGASRVHYVSERKTFPGPQIYHERNHWMVDNSDAVMAYWNPEVEKGGTYECRKYAKEVAGKPVANIWFDPPF